MEIPDCDKLDCPCEACKETYKDPADYCRVCLIELDFANVYRADHTICMECELKQRPESEGIDDSD